VAVRRRLSIDRPAKIERIDDTGGSQVECLPNDTLQKRFRYVTRPVQIRVDGDRLRHADGIGKLKRAPASQADK